MGRQALLITPHCKQPCGSEWVCMETIPTIFFVLVFSVFNIPLLVILICLPFVKQLGQALKEKSPIGGSTDATSYSRITGLVGAVAMTGFFWAIGNIVLLKTLTNLGEVKVILDSSWRFFLIGSALFMPYAFNQLKTIFPGTAAAVGAALANSKGTLDLTSPLTAPGVPPAQMLNLTVVNLSSGIDDATLTKTLAAIQIQVMRDFAPEWGIGASLTSKRISLTSGTVQVDAATDALIYLADSTQDPRTGVAGLAGYHAENRGDAPYGFVYLDVCETWKQSWTCTLSHEILELLADPTAVTQVAGPDLRVPGPNPPSVGYHLEVCDPTNADSYIINDVVVSNFVTKKYFGMVGASSFTNQLRLTLNAFCARPGGYVQFDDDTGVNETDGGQADAAARLAGRRLLGALRRNARRAARHPPPHRDSRNTRRIS
jgi:hypothetical protein